MPKYTAISAAALALVASLPLAASHANAQAAPLLVYVANLDIVPVDIDRFMAAAEENAADSMKDPGCREFNIIVAKDDPNHLLFFEVYDNAAAFAAHQATDHFKTYMAITKDMVAKRETRQFSSAMMNSKGE